MKDVEILYKDTRRAEVGKDMQKTCRHPWSQQGKEMEKPNVVWLCTLTKKYAKTFPLPSITPENRNCHHSLETISQLNGQIAKIPILGLAQFYLPSLTTVVDTVQNSFGNHDQMFHGFITWRVTQLSFLFFLLEMVGFPGIPADYGLWRYRTEKPWSKQQNQLRTRVQIPWNVTGSQPYLSWASQSCSKDIAHWVHSFATFFFLLFNLFL